MFRWKRPVDLQTKIVLVLSAVIVPTYLTVTIIQNQLTQPMLEQDLRQLGVSTAEALATQITSQRLLNSPTAPRDIERVILERLYLQPSIVRMDVFERLPEGNKLRLVASSVDDESEAPAGVELSDRGTAELISVDEDFRYWKIVVPIFSSAAKRSNKMIGMVQVWVSTRTVARVLDRIWQITGVGAILSIVTLVVVLSYFLRKTLSNEKLLRKTEHENISLMEQLHETQRQMMNTEKLTVMGQLTANFAHEIGTPLNAIGGHLQLLRAEMPDDEKGVKGAGKRPAERLEIIGGELGRIESIVKSFLQTTSKPDSQRQLVDLNALVDKTLGIVKPRIDAIGIELKLKLDRKMGPLRVVPTDIEQILLNLFNNASDSLKLKADQFPAGRLQLRVTSEMVRQEGEEWVSLSVYDTGVGISKRDLKNIAKPFFTTKRPGEGTGLGLAICRQIAAKYGGNLEFSSKEGAWAECRLGIPYRINV